jgi:predicted nuclease with TOPRIM domain
VGLDPFGEADAEFFFGRSLEVAIIAANLRASRLTVLYGPSGVGKSSLVMAGVVHRLRTEVDVVLEDQGFAVSVVRSWLDDPIRTVSAASREALGELVGAEPLAAPRETLVESLAAWTEQSGPLLLVLDQFEEYFQYHPEEGAGGELSGFAAQLAAIVNNADLAVNVLVSIREDAWPKLDIFEGHIPMLFENYIRVDHLDVAAAREAIEEPIAAWNRMLGPGVETYEIEGKLVDAVIDAASGRGLLAAGDETVPAKITVGGRIEAPFLQLVMERLWRATIADGAHALTRKRLDSLGGAKQIVENHVREALGRLTRREQDTASDSFRFLVSSDRTKIAQRAADLANWTKRAESQVTAVLEKLSSGESRILRAVAPAGMEGVAVAYELFHDVLAEPILTWRRGHEAARQRRRAARVGVVLVTLVAGFAALSVWALIEQGRANTLYHQQQAANRMLQLRVAELTQRRNAAASAAKGQTRYVARLNAENLALSADTRRLTATRSGLDREISGLRAENHSVGGQIESLNGENTAVAAKINELTGEYEKLSGELAPLHEQHKALLGDAAVLKTTTKALNAQAKAVEDQNSDLQRKLTELGIIIKPRSSTRPNGITTPSNSPHPATAVLFPVAGGPPSSNALRREIDALQAQLAKLLEQRARLANETRFLQKDNALLARERAALRREVEQLQQTVLRLDAQHRDLEQTLTNAEAEHALLTSMATSGVARNSRTRAPIVAQRAANQRLQAEIDGSIVNIGGLQSDLSSDLKFTKTLLGRLTAPVNKLITAAEDPAQAPSLAGLLAVAAYRVSPYNADDPAHPGVYNALWIALSRLDEGAAIALIAPTGNTSQKLGTTESALIVNEICSLDSGGFTQAQWSEFLPPEAPYTEKLSHPCGS